MIQQEICIGNNDKTSSNRFKEVSKWKLKKFIFSLANKATDDNDPVVKILWVNR